MTAAREFYVLVGLMMAAAVPMIVEIRADHGVGVLQVAAQIWTDALSAFTGDILNRRPVDRATLTGPVLALRLVYCLGPIVFYGLALKLIWSFPLTPVRHARLRERIERRNARRTAR